MTHRYGRRPLLFHNLQLLQKKTAFRHFLQPYIKTDTILQTHGNGEIDYPLKGIHVKLTARWEYKAPEGSGDTHYCLMKGSKANLEIKQGAAENYKPTLYIIPVHDTTRL